ncbi:D-alanyl-D-alanine carboxypeptidase/D-alanyl-D-alanine-endopeptidase [Fontimonas sp. SYSU GA230001]|uniref:D-alanyl-D-alanine carboxypeptidase/D-alanyl-D-alanine endopeptidase n=1 Tax=Fontimonas sp. SYSU GA230001 TaxID=3142450 RepID=UPI0032B453E0
MKKDKKIGSRVAALALFAASAAAQAEWKSLEALQGRFDARVTAVAVDLDSGATLQALDADRRLTPASLSKVVLAAAALETWDADKTFATRIVGAAPAADGKLAGDLVVYSEGDATFDHQDLWLLAAQLKQAGVHVVEGGVVVNAEPFGRLGCETKDRCKALARSHTAYDAPLAAIGVDYGTWCVDVSPAAPGATARVRSCAGVEVPIPLEGAIRTSAARRSTWLWLDRITRPAGEALLMGGDIHPGAGETRLYRSMADPALGTGLLLRQVLNEIGIAVGGAVSVIDGPLPRDRQLLAQTQSRPLREQVASLLRYSNNYISDVLTLAMAAERTPEPVTSLAAAARPLSDLVLRARQEVGYPPPRDDDRPLLLSGSGLTPENRLSAQDLVAVLRRQYGNTQTFPVFYGGLVVPGQAPHARLRIGNAAWRERVALKTGTLTEPYSVFGTAGYLRKRNGGWIAFAALVNGASPRKPVPSAESLAAIRKDVETLLAKF